MKSSAIKLVIVGLVVVAAVVVAALFITRSNKEPEFEEKPLVYWMAQELSDYPRRNAQAIRALRGMGEPAVKWLTAMVEREDSALTKQLLSYCEKAPALQNFVTSKYWYRYCAARTLGDIGPSASSAIPALEKMSHDPDRILSGAAEAALVLVRDEPLEKHISAYRDYANNTNSSKAFGLLMQLGPHAKQAIPILLQELQSTNNRIRIRALNVLSTVGAESQECLPVLTNLLSDINEMIRYSAADALANCGSMAKPATSEVVRLLNDEEYLCRGSALIFLLRVVPPEEFAPYRSLVQQATNDVNETVRGLAEQVLEEKQTSR